MSYTDLETARHAVLSVWQVAKEAPTSWNWIVRCYSHKKGFFGETLGEGATPEDAWIDAANKLAKPHPLVIDTKEAVVVKMDVYEVYGSCATARGWDFLVCKSLKDAMEHVEASVDDLEEGDDVRIVFRRYTQEQMDEVIYE